MLSSSNLNLGVWCSNKLNQVGKELQPKETCHTERKNSNLR